MDITLQAQVVVAGQVEGELLVSHEPLSFWGGYDYQSGTIIDQRHPLAGQQAAGRVLAVPFARGSSTTTAVLLESVKAKTAPLAILTNVADTFFTLASVVAEEMYGQGIPLFVLSNDNFTALKSNQHISISAAGVIKTTSFV